MFFQCSRRIIVPDLSLCCRRAPRLFTAKYQPDDSIGQLFFLLGPSGCGKSTILRIIAGLESPDSGEIFFDQEEVTSRAVQARDIGFVFQNYALWPHLTVRENITLPLNNKKLGKAESQQRLDYVVELLKLTPFLERKPHQLSGGQQQRVALARSLALKPKIILLDEPLSNLDARLKEEVLSELKSIHQQSTATFVYVTHDYSEAMSLGTQMAVMQNGNIIQNDLPINIYNKPANEFIAGFIGDINFINTNSSGKFAVRPEKILLERQPSAGSIKCKIMEKKFKEGFFKLTLQTEAGEKIKSLVDFDTGSSLKIDGSVFAVLAPESKIFISASNENENEKH